VDSKDKNGTEQKMDPQKLLLSKFQLNFAEFISKFRKENQTRMNPMTKFTNFYDEFNHFIYKFNKENAKSGYKITLPIKTFLENIYEGVTNHRQIEWVKLDASKEKNLKK